MISFGSSCVFGCFFFFKQKTAYEIRPCDWSSDVCSSDLTVGCGIRSRRSISPTDCWDRTRRLRIARRFGSAMMANADSMVLVYSTEHIRVKAYTALLRGSSRFWLLGAAGAEGHSA